jgi:hypothetical protein
MPDGQRRFRALEENISLPRNSGNWGNRTPGDSDCLMKEDLLCREHGRLSREMRFCVRAPKLRRSSAMADCLPLARRFCSLEMRPSALAAPRAFEFRLASHYLFGWFSSGGLTCVWVLCSIRSTQIDAGWSSPVARWAHNPKVVGSNPAPATN